MPGAQAPREQQVIAFVEHDVIATQVQQQQAQGERQERQAQDRATRVLHAGRTLGRPRRRRPMAANARPTSFQGLSSSDVNRDTGTRRRAYTSRRPRTTAGSWRQNANQASTVGANGRPVMKESAHGHASTSGPHSSTRRSGIVLKNSMRPLRTVK